MWIFWAAVIVVVIWFLLHKKEAPLPTIDKDKDDAVLMEMDRKVGAMKMFKAAESSYKRGDMAAAIKQAELILSTHGPDSLAYSLLGEIYYKRGDYNKALDLYERAYEAFPNKSYKETIAACRRKLIEEGDDTED